MRRLEHIPVVGEVVTFCPSRVPGVAETTYSGESAEVEVERVLYPQAPYEAIMLHVRMSSDDSNRLLHRELKCDSVTTWGYGSIGWPLRYFYELEQDGVPMNDL